MKPRTARHRSITPQDLVIWAAFTVAAIFVFGWAKEAHAQTNVLNFTAATSTGVESVVPDLAWSTTPPGATCVATGPTNWAGTKAASGTQTLPALTTSATYGLSCSWAPDTQASVTWTLPTQNTDGTPYADPKDLRLRYRYGTTGAFTELVITPPTTTARLVTGFTSAGTVEFFVFARNAADVESAASNRATKTFTGATAPVVRSVLITVNPRPNPPTLVGVL